MKPIVSARITIGGFRFALPTPRATHLTRPVNANASLCLNTKPQPQESRLDACWNACPLSHSCGRHDLMPGACFLFSYSTIRCCTILIGVAKFEKFGEVAITV